MTLPNGENDEEEELEDDNNDDDKPGLVDEARWGEKNPNPCGLIGLALGNAAAELVAIDANGDVPNGPEVGGEVEKKRGGG